MELGDHGYDLCINLCVMIKNYYNRGSTNDIKKYVEYLDKSIDKTITRYRQLSMIKSIDEFERRFKPLDSISSYDKVLIKRLDVDGIVEYLSKDRYSNLNRLWNAFTSKSNSLLRDIDATTRMKKDHRELVDLLILNNTIENRRKFVMKYLQIFKILVRSSCPRGSSLDTNVDWLVSNKQLNVALIPNVMGVIGINSHMYCLTNSIIPLVFSTEHTYYECRDQRPSYLTSRSLKEWPGFLSIDGCMNCPGVNISSKISHISRYMGIVQSEEIKHYRNVYNFILSSDDNIEYKKMIISSLLYSLYKFGITIKDMIRFKYRDESDYDVYFGANPLISKLRPMVDAYKEIVLSNTNNPIFLSVYNDDDEVIDRMGTSIIFTVDYIRSNLLEMDIVEYLMQYCGNR